MVNLFLFGYHVTERTYASTDCTGRVGETIICTFTIWSIDSYQNGIATDKHHMTTLWAHVSTHRGEVIYLEDVIDLIDRGLKSPVLVARVFLAGNCVDD